MSHAREMTVDADEDGMRLDRWFKQHFPELNHGQLQKLLRTGQIRVDGGRVKSSTRLADGQQLRLPPVLASDAYAAKARLAQRTADGPKRRRKDSPPDDLVREILSRVLYRDDDVLVINKPAGLAVQGGSGLKRHLDGILDALCFDAMERPRLVHRLDKDTSGVMALARNRKAAQWLTQAFREKTVEKLYWAAVAGVPRPTEGVVSLALVKKAGNSGQETMHSRGQQSGGTDGWDVMGRSEIGNQAQSDTQPAVTRYRMIERFGHLAAWLAMVPETGRTHQLRVHTAKGLRTPILGDGKYGREDSFPEGLEIPRKLHLHARRLFFKTPGDKTVDVYAEMPDHMRQTWERLGFAVDRSADLLF